MNTCKLARIATWAAWNACLLLSLYGALVRSSRWSENIFVFTTAMLALCGLASFFDSACEKAQASGRSVPAVIGNLPGVVICVACAGEGWFWLASAWVWIVISENMLFANSETK